MGWSPVPLCAVRRQHIVNIPLHPPADVLQPHSRYQHHNSRRADPIILTRVNISFVLLVLSARKACRLSKIELKVSRLFNSLNLKSKR